MKKQKTLEKINHPMFIGELNADLVLGGDWHATTPKTIATLGSVKVDSQTSVSYKDVIAEGKFSIVEGGLDSGSSPHV